MLFLLSNSLKIRESEQAMGIGDEEDEEFIRRINEHTNPINWSTKINEAKELFSLR